jgi:signal transduction histidine kinase
LKWSPEQISGWLKENSGVGFYCREKNEGSGLGLHVSKKLANLIGVNLAATSEYGKGTHFFISIPRT